MDPPPMNTFRDLKVLEKENSSQLNVCFCMSTGTSLMGDFRAQLRCRHALRLFEVGTVHSY